MIVALTPEEKSRLEATGVDPQVFLGEFIQVIHARYSEYLRTFRTGKVSGWYGTQVCIEDLNALRVTNGLIAELLGQVR